MDHVLAGVAAFGGVFNCCSGGNAARPAAFPDSLDHGSAAAFSHFLVYPHAIPNRHANAHSSCMLADGRHPGGGEYLLRGAR